MRNFATVLLLASLFVNPSAAQSERGAIRIQPVADAAAAGSAGLFIGVNDFEDETLTDLKFAVNDAVAMAHRFSIDLKLLPARKVRLCLAGKPTGPHIEQLAALRAAGATVTDGKTRTILGQLRAAASTAKRSSDILVVHASSHGFSDPNQDRPNRALLMPSDGFSLEVAHTAVPLDLIQARVEASKAGKRLVFLDACRSKVNIGEKGLGPNPAAARSFKAAVEKFKGSAVLLSCDDKQSYPAGRVVDPVGPPTGVYRVSRGGSWYSDGRRCRSAYRSSLTPDFRYRILGFRVAGVPSKTVK